MTLKEATRDFQRKYIKEVLWACEGNVCEAARVLGIHRNTASRFIELLGIDVDVLREVRRENNPRSCVRQRAEKAIEPEMMREYNRGSVYFKSPQPKPKKVDPVDRMLALSAILKHS